MSESKMNVSLRMRADLRTDIIQFAARERRSLSSLAAILLEWSFERLKTAGSTTKLLGHNAKRLTKLTRDRRFRDG
jgi:hypothetical protein